jgi:hypothetical protein
MSCSEVDLPDRHSPAAEELTADANQFSKVDDFSHLGALTHHIQPL